MVNASTGPRKRRLTEWEAVVAKCDKMLRGDYSSGKPPFTFTDTQWQQISSHLRERPNRKRPPLSDADLPDGASFARAFADACAKHQMNFQLGLEPTLEQKVRFELEIAINKLLHTERPLTRRHILRATDQAAKDAVSLLVNLVQNEQALILVLEPYDKEFASDNSVLHPTRTEKLQMELFVLLKHVTTALGMLGSLNGRPFETRGRPRPIQHLCWNTAARIYEGMTGRPVGASHAAPSPRASAGPARGPFVDFIKTLMAAVPGQPIPTGDQIRWFVRDYSSNGRNTQKAC